MLYIATERSGYNARFKIRDGRLLEFPKTKFRGHNLGCHFTYNYNDKRWIHTCSRVINAKLISDVFFPNMNYEKITDRV